MHSAMEHVRGVQALHVHTPECERMERVRMECIQQWNTFVQALHGSIHKSPITPRVLPTLNPHPSIAASVPARRSPKRALAGAHTAKGFLNHSNAHAFGVAVLGREPSVREYSDTTVATPTSATASSGLSSGELPNSDAAEPPDPPTPAGARWREAA